MGREECKPGVHFFLNELGEEEKLEGLGEGKGKWEMPTKPRRETWELGSETK